MIKSSKTWAKRIGTGLVAAGLLALLSYAMFWWSRPVVHVQDAVTGNPIVGAEVRLIHPSFEDTNSPYLTNRQGNARITSLWGLSTGDSVEVRLRGYEASGEAISSPHTGTVNVRLAPVAAGTSNQ